MLLITALIHNTLPVPRQPVHILMPEPPQMGQSAPVPPPYRSKIIQSRDLCIGYRLCESIDYFTFQISEAYWRMVRSELKVPQCATFLRHLVPKAIRSL